MNRPLVELQNVDVELGGRLVLRDVTWRLQPAQHWVILGRNGSGKSTFLRLIRGEYWPVAGSAGRRIYCLDGQPQTTAVGVKESVALVSPEQQNRYLYQEWSVSAAVVVQSGVHGGDYPYSALGSEQRRHIAGLMRLLRVEHLSKRNVQELSTGELRRILIARALAANPRVLVCDEMADGLDAEARATLLAALDDVAGEGTQLLLSTHRAGELPAAMTHRLVLEAGRVVEQGRLGEAESGARRKSSSTTARDSGAGARIKARGTRSVASLNRRARSPLVRPDSGELLVQVRNADVYLGLDPTLQGIHMEIRRGQHWAVVGPNGSGKSTLLKLIAGDVHPALGGRIKRFAFTARNTIWEVRARMGFVSPELQALYREPISVADAVTSGFFSSIGLMDKPRSQHRRRVREVLATLQLRALRDRNFLELSYGEARRVLLARALVKRPQLLLCDEPFDGLDQAARRQMSRALARAAAGGATLVIVTHHMEDLPPCITHVARLRGGRLEQASVLAT